MQNGYLHELVGILTASVAVMFMFMYLYVNERNDYLKIWGYSWLFNIFRYIVQIIIRIYGETDVLVFLKLSFVLAGGMLLIMGAHMLMDKKRPRFLLPAALSAEVLLAAALFDGASYYTADTAVFILSSAAFIYAGVIILLSGSFQGFGKKLTGISLVLWGIHKQTYPFIEQAAREGSVNIQYYSAGFQLAVFFTFTVSMGVIIMHFEKVKKLERHLSIILDKLSSAGNSAYYSFNFRPEPSVEVLSANAARLIGFSSDESRNAEIILRIADYEKRRQKSENPVDIESLPFTDFEGRTRWLEFYNMAEYSSDGSCTSLTGFVFDVSDKYMKFRESLNRMEWYEGMFRLSGVPMLFININTLMIEDANRAAEIFFGTGVEKMKNCLLSDSVFGENPFSSDFLKKIEIEGQGKMQCSFTGEKGGTKDFLLLCAKVRFREKEYIFAIVMDKSNEKYLTNRLFSLESIHKALLNAMDEGVMVFDGAINIKFMNSSAERILKYSPSTQPENLRDILRPGTENEESPLLEAVEKNRGIHRGEAFFKNSAGSIIPVAYSINKIEHDSYENGGVLVFRDITEERNTKDGLIAGLEEKNFLIREIHHRVKNNLQIVSSLLSIQSEYLNDEKAVSYFKNSIQRIKSMAIIHEMLYRGDSAQGLDFKAYLTKLVGEIAMTYTSVCPVYVDVECCEMRLNLDESIAVSLLITEIITNCYKHAFSKNSVDARINIRVCFTNDEKREILIADNGAGIEDADRFRNSDTLGSQIIISLISQLAGDLRIENNGGTAFILKF
ncbi:histidine kinase dimerization/phosphoacceptor domain -containing protein [Geovibrio ferrireducens]|uniref:histidine kinase dimerization/phosphoacceptor domain -containing protein n=1 Tax=Geovibrio ferrireducens TaxID=46201 RepID=UPI0022481D6A|nr:histidine kinase dimerization/phosphoacceptor domain -containing protein [Geovibrio ferrireducens]